MVQPGPLPASLGMRRAAPGDPLRSAPHAAADRLSSPRFDLHICLSGLKRTIARVKAHTCMSYVGSTMAGNLVAAPKTLRYEHDGGLPVAIEAKSNRRTYVPNNGHCVRELSHNCRAGSRWVSICLTE